MRHKLREYGLSITLLGLFFVIQVGLSLVGQRQYNNEQADHGQPTVSYLEYVRGPAFLEATMENWESEFLQMFAYVLLTAFLFSERICGIQRSREARGFRSRPASIQGR